VGDSPVFWRVSVQVAGWPWSSCVDEAVSVKAGGLHGTVKVSTCGFAPGTSRLALSWTSSCSVSGWAQLVGRTSTDPSPKAKPPLPVDPVTG
jgi:hypothetical protein